MDKTAIRTYAVDARRKLIEAVKLKAQQLYIFEDSAKTLRPGTESERLQADGIFLSYEQLKARERLYAELLHEDMPYKPAIYNRVLENVACTWFNRLIALRIMEVNDWLPSGIRVLSSQEPGRVEPDAMREVERLDYVKQAKIAELRADTSINASEKLYKYILVSQCNALSVILPGMFQRENDYTELLLPDVLLSKGGIVHDLVNMIHEDNFNVKEQGQIEIIGWLYQFYISEKKDEAFAGLKKNIKINKDTIPAATQLFTPEWIVKYMVENSLGRLWLEKQKSYKNSRFFVKDASGNSVEHPITEVSFLDYAGLADKWQYYLDEAPQSEEVENKLNETIDKDLDPRKIKLIDTCMGSGHILVYAFDVLYEIYRSMGYSTKDIPNLILTHNLYGLDIDDRAGQLAYFALMMKARSYNRRFFRQDNIPQPIVYAVPETKLYVIGLEKWLGASMTESDCKVCFNDLKYLAELFGKGKEYGSLLKIEREIDFERLRKYTHDFVLGQIDLDDTDLPLQADAFDRMIDVAELLSQKYDVVVTNPPYMAPAPSQADWVKKNYPDSKSDLCVVFIERNFDLLKQNGYLSMITMHSWMFLSSYEKFREKLIGSKDIVNMAHLGARAFEEIGGEVVQTVAFVMRRFNIVDYLATYARLVDCVGQQAKEEVFLSEDNRYTAKKENFEKIPGVPVAYWISEDVANAYIRGKTIINYVDTFQGIITGDNDKFLRYWFEVNEEKIPFHAGSMDMVDLGKQYWIPYNKGGEFRKWYGIQDYVVFWKYGAKDKTRGKQGFSEYYLREYVAWSYTISDSIATRYYPQGFLWDVRGSGIMDKTNNLYYLQGLISSKIGITYLRVKSSVLSCQVENIVELPIIIDCKEEVDICVKQNVEISRLEWNSFEICRCLAYQENGEAV